MKKGDANIWWVIIGAVIALVVVIVVLLIFTGRTGKLEGGLSSCEGKGGFCVYGSICPKNTLRSSAFDCDQPGAECCIGSPKIHTGTGDCIGDPINDVRGKEWCQ